MKRTATSENLPEVIDEKGSVEIVEQQIVRNIAIFGFNIVKDIFTVLFIYPLLGFLPIEWMIETKNPGLAKKMANFLEGAIFMGIGIYIGICYPSIDKLPAWAAISMLICLTFTVMDIFRFYCEKEVEKETYFKFRWHDLKGPFFVDLLIAGWKELGLAGYFQQKWLETKQERIQKLIEAKKKEDLNG